MPSTIASRLLLSFLVLSPHPAPIFSISVDFLPFSAIFVCCFLVRGTLWLRCCVLHRPLAPGIFEACIWNEQQ